MSPLVSVAIPTFNRRATIARAVRSALAQTHANLEVVVSDDGSTDGSAEVLQELAAGDERLRVVRHAANAGMVANMERARRLARGDYVMLLADDDWLDPRCVELALAALLRSPDHVAALGGVDYVGSVAHPVRAELRPLTAAHPSRRVRDYFAAVDGDHGNTWLYALIRRDAFDALSPLRNVLGFDWLHVAELAFLGKIALVDEVLIHRALGGTSETTARNVAVAGLPRALARIPHLAIGGEVLADVGWRSPVYAPLGRPRRLLLAVLCAAGVPLRNLRHVLFHLAPRRLQRRWHAR
ncbi:MAG TPA: glycosyltransferase family 2 protein [Thermoleophilaceae bacterium]|nr:glycosyltransferase family 2 protein [Thermoleophilaceae bacterium]